MLHNNKELRRGTCLLAIGSAVIVCFGFFVSALCGICVLAACSIFFAVYLGTEYARYRQLRRLSQELEDLLVNGIPLPIGRYDEGELSILSSQIQKMTLRLKESAEAVRAEKLSLADSLADISHQLRTPLTAMNLTATLLRSPGLPEEKRIELTAELRSLLRRTDWLVETLLKLSKLDAGVVQFAADRVSVRELISLSAQPLAIPMELREQQLIVRCEDAHFTGDLTWSAEALGNILKNCMEHTPEDGIITVTAKETALFTQILVEDTGPGFDSRDIPHLFERFYKGSSASQTGYGIGLALARTVIAAQNGTVQALNTASGAGFLIKFYKQVI